MEDKIKLLLRYIKKEKELTLEWDKEDGVDVESPDYKMYLVNVGRLQALISYRNIRIEEDFYLKLNSGKTTREVRERATEYDAERSRRHALALRSLKGFNEFAEMYGMEKFYDGEMLTSHEIDNYKNIDVRKEETAFFLQFIEALNRTSATKMQEYFDEVGIEHDKEESSFMRELRSNISKPEYDYGVIEPPLDEDGVTKFKGEEDFGMQLG